MPLAGAVDSRSRPAILIAESENDLRQLLDHLLHDAAYETALAADGIEVVRSVARMAPDLLILDLDLAGLDGLLAFEVVRALTDSLPVVVITSLASPALVQAAERLGVLAILRKPFRNADLLDAVARGLALTGLRTARDSRESDGRVAGVPPATGALRAE